ncbi:AAC(3) family N-acetyltransferase, partial [Alphaproteobacteria bacterium]|nr:AAC(3) family N-acetyltransferase [Alphaproteobacteria bacterium]
SLVDIENILKKVVSEKFDVIYLATDLTGLNMLHLERKPTEIVKKIGELIQDIFYQQTVVFPTSTLNLSGTQTVYDARQTPSHKVGFLNEHLRKNYNTYRSAHPFWSNGAFGPLSELLLKDIGWNAYGFNSVWERMLKHNVLCLNLGVNLRESMPVIHHLEQCFGVPYRRIKVFKQKVINFEGQKNEGLYSLNVIPHSLNIVRDKNIKLTTGFNHNFKALSDFEDIQCYRYVDLYNHLYAKFMKDMFAWVRNTEAVEKQLIDKKW